MEIRVVNRVLLVALLFSFSYSRAMSADNTSLFWIVPEEIVCASYERIPPSQCRELYYRIKIKGQRRYKNKTIKECVRLGESYEIVCCLYDLDIKKELFGRMMTGESFSFLINATGEVKYVFFHQLT